MRSSLQVIQIYLHLHSSTFFNKSYSRQKGNVDMDSGMKI